VRSFPPFVSGNEGPAGTARAARPLPVGDGPPGAIGDRGGIRLAIAMLFYVFPGSSQIRL
jgi:hypothetical protein